MACREVNDQKGTSRCLYKEKNADYRKKVHHFYQAVGFANGSLINAWSCQILTQSIPSNSAAIFPITDPLSNNNSLTELCVCHKLTRWFDVEHG